LLFSFPPHVCLFTIGWGSGVQFWADAGDHKNKSEEKEKKQIENKKKEKKEEITADARQTEHRLQEKVKPRGVKQTERPPCTVPRLVSSRPRWPPPPCLAFCFPPPPPLSPLFPPRTPSVVSFPRATPSPPKPPRPSCPHPTASRRPAYPQARRARPYHPRAWLEGPRAADFEASGRTTQFMIMNTAAAIPPIQGECPRGASRSTGAGPAP
jgi:hypothetical protein